MKLTCYWPVIADFDSWGIGLVVADESGYYPLPELGLFDSYAGAEYKALELNTKDGITNSMALKIVGSSMFPRGRKK
jgi:hypothetical protein